MTLEITLLVLLAAALHAGWNALVRADGDRLGAMARLALATSALTTPLLPFFGLPNGRAWMFLAGTLVLHTLYMLFLARAYEEGSLGKVYPLARGTAPLIVTIASVAFLGERLTVTELAGIVLLAAAIISLAWREPDGTKAKPALYALITSLFIAAYTLVDGLGGRAAQSPHVYVLWLFALYGYPLAFITLWRRGAGFLGARAGWPASIGGAAMSIAAYWIVVWAMKRAPLGPVAALRETSVVVAVLISGLLLKEPLTRRVYLAAMAVAAGVALLRL